MRALGKLIAGCGIAVGVMFAEAPDESDYYRIETYPIPSELKLEVSGMASLPDGRVGVAIRKGEVWILEGDSDPETARWRPFASGLHEPLGLAWHEGALYTVQRTELTRLVDENGDGIADTYDTVAKGWGVTGNYHEYAYGPVFDPDGTAWLTLNCSIGTGSRPKENQWRGWSLRVPAAGGFEPVSGGLRSPSGLGVNLAGDVFTADQQGNWFATCALIHLRSGIFHGHADALAFCDLPGATFSVPQPLPKGLTVVEAAARIEAYALPAVWFPYRKMGMSATDLLVQPSGGSFPEFAGQFFVGEFTQSFVSRVFLERVEGEYQGACFRFREGLQCAALRLAWGADGALLVGQSNRGWNSLGTRSFGLQRIVRSDQRALEIRRMEARPSGFRLVFTLPLDRALAGDVSQYAVASYTYPYRQAYGGDELDRRELDVRKATVSGDGRTVDLEVAGLRAGYVHELVTHGLRTEAGQALLHPEAYYTLNRIPRADSVEP